MHMDIGFVHQLGGSKDNLLTVRNSDMYIYSDYYYYQYIGFRPLVLLNSDFTLEKTKDSNGNDAFKIVEQ